MNEEGKMNGSELNRALRDSDKGNLYDIIAGDFLVVGLGEEDFCSFVSRTDGSSLKRGFISLRCLSAWDEVSWRCHCLMIRLRVLIML